MIRVHRVIGGSSMYVKQQPVPTIDKNKLIGKLGSLH